VLKYKEDPMKKRVYKATNVKNLNLEKLINEVGGRKIF